MPRAEELIHNKPDPSLRDVVSIRPDETALAAAKRMNERRIGALVVLDDRGRLAGIVSERDILTRVVAADKRPDQTRVADIMTKTVVTCAPDTRLPELRRVMRERRVRHVPVVEGDRVVGMISIGDVNAAEAGVMSETIRYLEQYMTTI